ncbi:helix-turn-helix domain-containing protein [Streptomyces sp. NBC_01239]|uniref:ArsR/SmtB family transcription factor n=1 Tax=Streptomyces sp. NBC_01239 TaxID=2903792 RepID=UPI002257596C|nr:helix-turn-helix domain-containing protein [Streptomyces sp. NBC_01239]MCX4810384.1 helix-turn-helix domain-containing protein [Streptomyces sp. NBC_01239]
MSSKETRAITDLGTLKAFAHPLRVKLYRALYVARTATASQLADQVGEAVSLVSYHLRKLAEHGLIEEAEAQGEDGRERWWRPASESLTVRHEDVKDAPEKLAAQGALTRILLEQRVDLYRRHLDESDSWNDEWHSAGFESEYLPRLNASELAELQVELDTLIRKYQARGRAAETAGDTQGRENVAVHVYGFPFRV